MNVCCHCELEFIANYFWIFTSSCLLSIGYLNQIERSEMTSIFGAILLFSLATFHFENESKLTNYNRGSFLK